MYSLILILTYAGSPPVDYKLDNAPTLAACQQEGAEEVAAALELAKRIDDCDEMRDISGFRGRVDGCGFRYSFQRGLKAASFKCVAK